MKLFCQLHSDIRNINLNFMDCVTKSKMLERIVLDLAK